MLVLDDVGHGVRNTTPRMRQRGTSQSSIQSINLAQGVGPAPTTKPPTPPSVIRGTGSLSKNSREYRAPPAVAPPQVSIEVLMVINAYNFVLLNKSNSQNLYELRDNFFETFMSFL